jgi:hypothetical protein
VDIRVVTGIEFGYYLEYYLIECKIQYIKTNDIIEFAAISVAKPGLEYSKDSLYML